MKPFAIAGRKIGPAEPAYIVAEMSANHNGSYAEAERIVRAAKEAGADAIKLQTYTADTLTIDSDEKWFKIKGTLWNGATLHKLYGQAYTPWDWQPKLKKLADKLGLHCFSSPFDATAVDFLEKMDVPAHKVASFECVDIPLLRKVAKTKKPVIVSTGMATREDVEDAVRTLKESGSGPVALLKCTSAYPSTPEEMDLLTIPDMAERFGLPVGLSDHTMGHAVAVAARSLGACIYEKHMTMSRKVKGPDSQFSLEPAEFAELVSAIRTAEKALGRVRYGPAPREEASRVFRRSLFVVEDVEKGEPFTPVNLRSIRPGYGLKTKHIDEVMGRRAAKAIRRGTPLSWDLVQGSSRGKKK